MQTTSRSDAIRLVGGPWHDDRYEQRASGPAPPHLPMPRVNQMHVYKLVDDGLRRQYRYLGVVMRDAVIS